MLYAFGNLSSKIISFVLVFFTTYYLSKADLGLYDIIITTVALISPFIYLQLTDAILRYLLTNNSILNTSKVFTNICCIIIASIFVFSAIYWTVASFVIISNQNIIFWLILSSSLLPIMQIFSRGNGKNALFAGSSVMFSFIFTAFTILFLVVFKLKVEGVLYANITANVATFMFIYFTGKYYSNFDLKQFNYFFCKELLVFSLPLIPNSIMWWLFSSANRYIVLYFLGLELNGIWSISYKIPTVIAIFTSIFFMAWQEKSIKVYNDPGRDTYYTDILNTYVSLSLGIIIMLTAASKPMLYFLVEQSFFISWKYGVFLMLASFFQSLALFYGVGYYCANDTKHILYTTLIGSFSTIISSIILVPYLHLYGAGIATLLGFLVMFLIRLKQTRKYFTIRYPFQKTICMFAGIAVCYLVSFIDSIPIQVINNLSAVTIAFYINRKFILNKLSQWKTLDKIKSLYV